MSQFQILQYQISKQDPQFNDLLQYAYENKITPYCLCKTPPLAMYIAKYEGEKFAIKRMPNSGYQHNINCESFTVPEILSGKESLSGSALVEDSETGFTNLKLDFSLTKNKSTRTHIHSNSSEQSDVESPSKRMTITALLHFLYEEANLNRWSPKMKNKRNWFVVRKYLLLAAEQKVTKKAPLLQSLLIPEVFTVEKKEYLKEQYNQYLKTLHSTNLVKKLGILIGELKSIDVARYGFKFMIKHLPELPAYCSEELFKKIERKFQTELSFFYEDANIHLLTIFTFSISPTGNLHIETISFMLVDENWIPFSSFSEFNLNKELYSSNKHFIKGLRYNLQDSAIIASAVTFELNEKPTAFYTTPPKLSEDYISKLALAMEDKNFNHVVKED